MKINLLTYRPQYYLKPLLALFLVLFFVQIQAQIETKIDRNEIKLGQPIAFELSVPLEENKKVVLPKVKDTLSFHLEILDQKIDTLVEDESIKLVQKLKITSFDPGEFLIRSLPVIIDSDTLLSHSFLIQVEDVVIDSANLNGFPIKPIMGEKKTWLESLQQNWLLLTLILLGMLFVLGLIYFLLNSKSKKEKNRPIKTPYDEAIWALKELDQKQYLKNKETYLFYSDLSDLLRRYLGRIYQFRSMELLSDDLANHLKSTNQLTDKEISQLSGFLYDSDLVKYAKNEPETPKQEFYRKWVETLIERTKPMDLEVESNEHLKSEKLKYRVIKDD